MRKINFTQLRVITLSGGLVLVSVLGSAQTPVTPPTAYDVNIKTNYIRTWDAMAPETDPNNLMSRPLKDVKQATQYFDGLGRPLQTVIKQGSLETGGTATDMVSAVVYDEFGREQYKYLPFPSNNTGSNPNIDNGLFKLNPFQQQAAFMTSQYGPQGETFFYSKTNFEASPLNRVEKSMAPGNSWVGSNRGIRQEYTFNDAAETAVRIWNIASAPGSLPTSPGVYAPNQLFRNATFDEHNTLSFEYVDKEGRTVLKSIQNGSEWFLTFYVYDDLGNLRCVIPPKAVPAIWSNWTMTQQVMDELCFRYEYDQRNRMIKKKVPGAGEVCMVYDARDRLVMTQDANMRVSNKWLVTKYDELNRPIETGLWVDTTAFTTHLTNANTSTTYPVTSTGYEELTKTFYDDYSWLAANGNPFPSSNYDNSYNTHFQAASDINWPYGQTNVQSFQLKGMPTGNKIKILGTATYLYTISFYDVKGRVIQVQSKNITGGIDIMTTQYSWAGQPLVMIQKQEKQGVNAQTSVVVSQMTYDDLGRLVKTEKKLSNTLVNGNAMPAYKTIAQHEYDKLGQLKNKKLAPAYNNNAGLETENYDYNIRGWTLGMNRSYVKDTTSTANWFGFDLGYDKTSLTVNGTSHSYTAAQYNGNINGMLWRSTGDDMLRKYDFTYDAANRFLSADFNQLNSNSFSKAAGIDFSVTGMNYDANGNILNMNQKGWKLGGSVTIDSLLYTYMSNSNKLLNVLDRNNDTTTKLGDFRSSHAYMTALSNNKTTAATDYSYDGNGNIYVDNNKDIGNIHYNYLNLPDSITVTNKGNIKYVYDATGNKLKKITTEGSNTTTTLYLFGNFVNDTLQFLPQEEGRVRFKVADNSLQYDYFIKDHLGNVRMVLTEETQTDAYPVASLETTPLANERLYYSKVDSGRVNKSTVSGYPSDTYTNPNDYIQKLSGNEVKIGTGTVLKVMAGDKFNIRVNSWWNSGDTPGTSISPLNDLISALSGSIGSLGGSHATAAQITSSGVLSPNATSFLNSQSGYTTSKPKAFINWILFDERFAYVFSSSGFEQVGNSNTFTTHTQSELPVNKNGYLYVYVSNETPNINVFFDNLQVTHIRGPLISEESFYAFGLSQAGISSKALAFGNPENKRNKFQNQEFNNDLDVAYYEFKWRHNDPQTGRFIQIDPLADKYVYNSTYAFSENKVTGHVELEGLESSQATNNNRYATTRTYNEDKRAYREINSFTPYPRGVRQTGIFIPNQQSGSAPKPANIYEPFKPGTGTQFTGPFVTSGNNAIGQTAVGATELLDNYMAFIGSVQFTSEHHFPVGELPRVTEVGEIKWLNADAEKSFNQMQLNYNKKVQEIINANQVGPKPPDNASSEEKQKWETAVGNAGSMIRFKVALLGPSPLEIILEAAKNNKDFKLQNSTTEHLPEVSNANPHQ